MDEHGEVPGCRPAAPETPLEDDDLLGGSSSASRRGRPRSPAPRSFRGHHRRPPLLGFFSQHPISRSIELTPALDPPDRLPAARFTLPLGDRNLVGVDCRHGRVLALNQGRRLPHPLVVWDPVTGDQLHLPLPPAFDCFPEPVHGAVVCAAGDEDHAYGDCSSSPFQVVAVGTSSEGSYACVYSSETGSWGNLISMLWPSYISQKPDDWPFLPVGYSSTQVGNRICWMLVGMMGFILEFDLGTQSLAITELPLAASDISEFIQARCQFLIVHADGGRLGLLAQSGLDVRLWKRKANNDGVAGWILGNTIDLSSLLSLSSGVGTTCPKILGFDEGGNAMLLLTYKGAFTVHVETLQFKKLPAEMYYGCHLPITSFYPIGA
ncbi:hypothetical protein ACP4OV_003063 [Aristida adscensionis]